MWLVMGWAFKTFMGIPYWGDKLGIDKVPRKVRRVSFIFYSPNWLIFGQEYWSFTLLDL